MFERFTERATLPLSLVTSVLLILACSACSRGDDAFAAEEVVDAYAAHGIALTQVIDYPDGSPLQFVLGPAIVPRDCLSEDLRINVYRGGSDVDDQLARAGLDPGARRYAIDGDAGAVIVLVRHNVLVAVAATSKCFSESGVSNSLESLR